MKYKIDNNIIEIEYTGNTINLREYLNTFIPSKKILHNIKDSILINNKKAYYNNNINNNDIITITYTNDEHIDFIAQEYNLDVVYEDNLLLIVNKPNNLIVHPETKEGLNTLCNFVAYYYQINNLDIPVRYIHRLDYQTSGLIMFCKHPLFQPYFDLELSEKNISREYLAIVNDHFPSRLLVEKSIGKHRHINNKYIVSNNGKYAKSLFTLLEYNNTNNTSLINCKLYTGRTHQIRVHLSYYKFPIINDSIYNNICDEDSMKLQAYKLNFNDPITNKNISIQLDKEKRLNVS